MIHTQETISRELKRIQDNVPEMFKTLLFKEVEKTPDIKMVFEKVASGEETSKNISQQQAQEVLDSGMLDKKTLQENPKVAKQRDIWVQKEIKNSVKEGRLPNRKQLKELKLDHYGK